MKRTVTESMFVDAFTDYNREDNFSYQGRKALFEFFEEMEDGTGEETELDVIAICCEFSEYKSLEAWALEHHGTEYLLEACEAMGIDEDIATGDDAEEISNAIMDYLNDHTLVIAFEGGIIIQDF